MSKAKQNIELNEPIIYGIDIKKVTVSFRITDILRPKKIFKKLTNKIFG